MLQGNANHAAGTTGLASDKIKIDQTSQWVYWEDTYCDIWSLFLAGANRIGCLAPAATATMQALACFKSEPPVALGLVTHGFWSTFLCIFNLKEDKNGYVESNGKNI